MMTSRCQRMMCRAGSDLCIGIDPGQVLCLGHSVLQATELINKSLGQRILAAPDTATGAFIHLVIGHAASFCDKRQEAVIAPLEEAVQHFPLFVGETFNRGERARERTAHGHGFGVHTYPAQAIGQCNLATENTD